MLSLPNSVVLIGFKHTGKSAIGKDLARKLNVPFSDVDQLIESLYESKCREKSTCRQIVRKMGEPFFRHLERDALSQAVTLKPSVISLGGGAPMNVKNQNMIKPFIVVHVTAPKHIVLERIYASGQPACLSPEENLLVTFNQIWNEREPVYEKIKAFKGPIND